MIPRGLILLGALLVFGVVNRQIAGKERLRATGQSVFLEMAPIDPRSLMQGDYMALRFAVVQDIPGQASGTAILSVDPRGIGQFARMDRGAPLNPGEVRFRFRVRNGAIWLGTNAFFMHEGDAGRYRQAHYGEFRVNPDGDAMLIGLRDRELLEINH